MNSNKGQFSIVPIVRRLRFKCPRQVWMMRHPESEANQTLKTAKAQHLLRFRSVRDADVAVTPRGERQTEALGRWLADQDPRTRPNLVVTSTYQRAFQPAEKLSKYLSLSQVFIDERLRERDYGILDNLTEEGTQALEPLEYKRLQRVGRYYYCPPGGESWCQIMDRIRDCLRDIAENYPGARPLLVSHSRANYCFRCLMEDYTESRILAFADSIPIPNCSLVSYHWNRRRRTFVRGLDSFTVPEVDDTTTV